MVGALTPTRMSMMDCLLLWGLFWAVVGRMLDMEEARWRGILSPQSGGGGTGRRRLLLWVRRERAGGSGEGAEREWTRILVGARTNRKSARMGVEVKNQIRAKR